MPNLIFWGAGGAGRETLAACRKRRIAPMFFADNNPAAWGSQIDGVPVLSPQEAFEQLPQATYVVTVHQHFAKQIRQQLRERGLKLGSIANYLPVMKGLPPTSAMYALRVIVRNDERTYDVLADQIKFRQNLDYDSQSPPDDFREMYFPPFVAKLEGSEVFVDCGAADGDSIQSFLKWHPDPRAVVAFEPDPKNYEKLSSHSVFEGVSQKALQAKAFGLARQCAVTDYDGDIGFAESGDTQSHVSESGAKVKCATLDKLLANSPTYIKMDIEGHELRALWGARRILKEHKPVLAICAYHESDHLWEIPLLINAIQPDYQLRLRRYAEGARELCWYGVPKERLIHE